MSLPRPLLLVLLLLLLLSSLPHGNMAEYNIGDVSVGILYDAAKVTLPTGHYSI